MGTDKLTIENFDKIANYFDLTDYIVLSVGSSDEEYTTNIQHRSVHRKRYTFVLKRKGYLTDGEWYHSTTVAGRINQNGVVGRDFLKDPANLAKHILISIEHYETTNKL